MLKILIDKKEIYVQGKPIEVGEKIKFKEEKQSYTVKASNIVFAICTKPMNALHTVLYTVVDWNNNIRGTENLIFGEGAETDEQCKEMLDRLTNGKSEVSKRNQIPLVIEKIKNLHGRKESDKI